MSTLKPQTRVVAGHTFSFLAKENENGAYAWTSEHEGHFNAWLSDIWKRHKSDFTIQGSFPPGIEALIKDFLVRHPGGQESDVIRAAVIVYFDLLKDQSEAQRVEEIYRDPEFQAFLKEGEPKKFKVRVKPALFMDVEGWSSAFAMPAGRIVSEAVQRLMSCYFRVIRKEYEEFAREIEHRMASYVKAA